MTQEQTQEQPDRHIMTVDEMREHEWIVSWSGGKDSTATIILMHEHNIPIKKIVYVRMMFDETTPATLPIMNNFIEIGAAKFREWGYNVELVKSIKTAMQVANRKYKKSTYGRVGTPYGITAFMRGFCSFTDVKQKTIRKYCDNDDYQMIGYAADEAHRVTKLGGKNQSIMFTLGITTPKAFKKCREYGLLSPAYEVGANRDGCFFCPNIDKQARDRLRKENPELIEHINKLIDMAPNLENLRTRNHWLEDHFRELEEAADPHKQTKLSDF